ncbi:co-chaperone GroES [Candidatus Omnitrophota bacterium]
MMDLQPLADRVLVKPLEAQETSKGGIVIPDTAKEKPQEGKVVAVGKGKRDGDKIIPLEVKVGDKVLYGKYSGTELMGKDGDDYLMLREDDILALVK